MFAHNPLEQRDSDGNIVDEGAAPSLPADGAAYDELVGEGDAGCVEQVMNTLSKRRGNSQGRTHRRFARVRAHQLRARSRSAQQVHRIEKDGLSRARLTRKDGKTGAERQRDGIDENKIANRQFEKHVETPEVEGRGEEAGSLTSHAVTLLRASVFWPKR